jgi:hypothetical protein
MARKTTRKRTKKTTANRRIKKLKLATVPYATVPKDYFDQLLKLRKQQHLPLSRLEEIRQKQEKAKNRKRKYRIWDMMIVLEFRATPAAAKKRLDKISAQEKEDVRYWLTEVPPRRPRLPRC